MGAPWCADNLRDLAGWKASGMEFSTTSNESVRLLDGAIRQLVSWRDCVELGGIVKTLENLIAADPNCVMARCFITALEALQTGKSPYENNQFANEIKEVEQLAEKAGNDREKKHVKAMSLFARGFLPEAEIVWESILADYPKDLIAIKFAHDSYFFSGNAAGKRDSVARVINQWKKDEPCYSYLHGMYAFGLEECFQFDEAEKHAKTALSLRKEDCWATHAAAHVMEMNGRTKEGRQFMEKTMDDWEPGYILACHNFWHYALYFIEDGEYERALALFDEQCSPRSVQSGAMLDIVDSCSLLWRLELEGVNVGDRWPALPSFDSHLHDHVLAFNDIHMGFAMKRAGHAAHTSTLRDSMSNFITTGDGNNRRITEEVGLHLLDGMLAFADEQYDKAVDLIFPVRKQIYSIGGSHAQNDVFVQTLLQACLKSDNQNNKESAKIVLSERNSRKKNSGISNRYEQKLRSAHE